MNVIWEIRHTYTYCTMGCQRYLQVQALLCFFVTLFLSCLLTGCHFTQFSLQILFGGQTLITFTLNGREEVAYNLAILYINASTAEKLLTCSSRLASLFSSRSHSSVICTSLASDKTFSAFFSLPTNFCNLS